MKPLRSKIGLWLTSFTRRNLRQMSTPTLAAVLQETITTHTATLPPQEALRFLFKLDNLLYELESQAAVDYGKGVHTKHRHTRYADFFVGHLTPGERVLDVGTGIGKVANTLADAAQVQIVGIDISPENIAFAKKTHAHPQVEYVLGDVLGDLTGLLTPPFDVVLLSNVLEHLPDRPALLKRLQQFTHAKRFLIRVPLFERDWRVPLKQEIGMEWRLDLTHETEYTLESFRQEMAEAGLMIQLLEVHWGEIWSVLQAP